MAEVLFLVLGNAWFPWVTSRSLPFTFDKIEAFIEASVWWRVLAKKSFFVGRFLEMIYVSWQFWSCSFFSLLLLSLLLLLLLLLWWCSWHKEDVRAFLFSTLGKPPKRIQNAPYRIWGGQILGRVRVFSAEMASVWLGIVEWRRAIFTMVDRGNVPEGSGC